MFFPLKVGWSKLFRQRDEAQNAGAVTVLAGGTDIVTMPARNVFVGEFVLAQCRLQISKGATAGQTDLLLNNGGSASIVWVTDSASPRISDRALAAQVMAWHLIGIGRVTVSGTLTLAARGVSAGSNSTVAIGECKVRVEIANA